MVENVLVRTHAVREIFDVAGGAECHKPGATVAHRTAKAPTAAHREFAAIRIRTRSRSPETAW